FFFFFVFFFVFFFFVCIWLIGDGRRKQMDATGSCVPVQNTIWFHPGTAVSDDNPKYHQTWKYYEFIAVKKQPWVA
ncbi:hypothetical protein, partial [Escherichia coli]|uniref:hypothetical protein n=1 Tax=Escherichia coli TaxID=562 RepID=UPI001BAF3E62